MTDASQDRAIGRIEGKMDLIIVEQGRATESRRQTYEKLDALGRKIESVNSTVTSIDDRLQKVEEPVADFSKWRERAIGAVMLVSMVSATIGGLMVAFGRKIWAVIIGQ